MEYYDAWMRNEVINLRRDLDDLKKNVEFQQRVIEMQSAHIAEIKANMTKRPLVQEFTAADAYRKAIEIAEKMRGDFWTRSIPDPKAKEWVTATVNDIVNAIQYRLDRCEGRHD